MARKKRPDGPGGVTAEANGPPPDGGPPGEEFVGPPAPPEAAVEPVDVPVTVTEPVTAVPPLEVPPAAPEVLLEDRLRRLETTLTQLQQIEQRLTQLQNAPVAALAPAPPGAITATPSEKTTLLSSAAALLGPVAGLIPSVLTRGDPNRSRDPFSLSETLAELRSMHRMFVDPRYSMSWVGRFAPIPLLLMFVFPSVWVPGAAFIPTFVNPVGELVVGFALFKVLTREARRYRERAPDLPPSLRL